MVNPTLLIGLGSSGMYVLAEVQKLMYETFGLNSLPICRSIYVETDIGAKVESTPAGTEITPVRLVANNGLEQMLAKLLQRNDLDLDWVSRTLPREMPYTQEGAGGIRPAGRLLLWGENNFATLYSTVEQAHRSITQAILNPDPGLVQQVGEINGRTTKVFVVGSLVGGTCSGTFIDIGYVMRSICGQTQDIHAVFLLPRENDSLTMGFGNCHGALLELDYFDRNGIKFREKWPNNLSLNATMDPPYAISYLISTAYGDPALPHMDLRSLYKVTGLWLFSNFLGLSAYRGTRLADGQRYFKGRATFGISAVMYPKYSLMEAGACRLGQDLCDRWLSKNTIIGSDQRPVAFTAREAINLADDFFDRSLRGVFRALGSAGAQASSLESQIQDDVLRILKKDISNPRKHFQDQFYGNAKGNLYSVVHENVSSSKEHFTEELRKFILAVTDEKQNLYYTRALLEAISSSISKTLGYWRQLNIPDEPNQWTAFIDDRINWLLRDQHRVFLMRLPTLVDRSQELLKFLKMFAFRPVLESLKEAVERVAESSSNALPSVERVDQLVSGFEKLRSDLEERYKAIQGEVSDQAVPILRVWKHGSFEEDLQVLLQTYAEKFTVPSLKDVSSSSSAWEVFNENIQTVRHQNQVTFICDELADMVKSRLQERLNPLLLDQKVNPAEYAARMPEVTVRYARMATAGLLPLQNYDRGDLQGIPRFVLGPNHQDVTSMLDAFGKGAFTDFQKEHIKTLPSLDHAVIFYDERPNIDPFKKLAIRHRMAEHFDQPDGGFVDETHTGEVWRQHRLAYGVDPTRRGTRDRQEKVQKYIKFCIDFGIKYKKEFDGRWEPSASRWDKLRINIGKRLMFIFRDANGLDTPIELDLENISKMRVVASDRQAYEALQGAICTVVKETPDAQLKQIFNEEIQVRLRDENKDQIEIGHEIEFYFGSGPNSDQKGVISELTSQGHHPVKVEVPEKL